VTSVPDDRAYEAYLGVRDAVLRMKAVTGSACAERDQPSHYWAEELENFHYMIEASPLIIRKLRQHAFHVTGIRRYDYRGAGDQQAHFERRLQALIDLGGRELLVAESPALGGFGFPIDGALYNADTLKFFEAMVAMKRGGVLAPFMQAAKRRLVWEIGAGWGGFAYQFKTLFPATTYLIVDFAEMFLYSATYLRHMFPDALLRFWDGRDDIARGWPDADFIFIPQTALNALRGFTPDLVLNLVSFQEMTATQVYDYARCAASLQCSLLYSLNRERSPYNTQIASVSDVLRQYFDLTEVRLLGSDYTKATKKDSALSLEEGDVREVKARDAGEEQFRYRHMIGKLRSDVAAAHGARAGSSTTPRVAIGATLFNRATFLREALDSLLCQSFGDFRLVLVDDASTDETEAIAREYAARDHRITYVRHEQRRGMVATWREAFELATTAPWVEYFAWASDHDRWHAEWLLDLVSALDAHREVVLAYPQTQRISLSGDALAKPARLFDTFGVIDQRARWLQMSTTRSLAAGDMVYGLMRVDALRDSGVFREVLSPDRLLMAELTIRGQIHQVPRVLWYRRQFETGSVARQKQSLFGPAGRPRGSTLPTWLQHARILWREYATAPATPLAGSRIATRWLIVRYAAAYASRHHSKTTVHRRFAAFLEGCRYVYKRAKHVVLLTVFYTLVYGRRVFWGTIYYVLVGFRRIGVTAAIERLYERVTGRSRPRASQYR
jgi:glycosyltransferase involved in cell wall biosynthesis